MVCHGIGTTVLWWSCSAWTLERARSQPCRTVRAPFRPPPPAACVRLRGSATRTCRLPEHRTCPKSARTLARTCSRRLAMPPNPNCASTARKRARKPSCDGSASTAFLNTTRATAPDSTACTAAAEASAPSAAAPPAPPSASPPAPRCTTWNVRGVAWYGNGWPSLQLQHSCHKGLTARRHAKHQGRTASRASPAGGACSCPCWSMSPRTSRRALSLATYSSSSRKYSTQMSSSPRHMRMPCCISARAAATLELWSNSLRAGGGREDRSRAQELDALSRAPLRAARGSGRQGRSWVQTAMVEWALLHRGWRSPACRLDPQDWRCGVALQRLGDHLQATAGTTEGEGKAGVGGVGCDAHGPHRGTRSRTPPPPCRRSKPNAGSGGPPL